MRPGQLSFPEGRRVVLFEESYNGITDADSSSISLSKQLEACDGQRLLLGLLTSPSASINLAGGRSHVSGGLRELRTTASVQGMSSRQVGSVSQLRFLVPGDERLIP
jgi:hypothetical protein